MITNKANFAHSLLHRLGQCSHLAQKPETLGYLPEIIIRSLRDAYRLIADRDPHNNTPALCGELGIPLETVQAQTLLFWEDALTGEVNYATHSVDMDSALALALLLQKRLDAAF